MTACPCMWIVAFALLPVILATAPQASPTDEDGKILCWSIYRNVREYRWLFNNVTYSVGQERMSFPTEGTVRCAVELEDSVTKWSNEVTHFVDPSVTMEHNNIQVQPEADIAFNCNIELGNLTRRVRIEYIELYLCNGVSRRLLRWDIHKERGMNNMTAMHQNEEASIQLEDLSVTLNRTTYGDAHNPLCIACRLRLVNGSNPVTTTTEIEFLNYSEPCARHEETMATAFSLDFTAGTCLDYQEGELIKYLMKKHECLADARFSVDVMCEENARTALVVVTSLVMVDAELMSGVLQDIATVREGHVPPSTSEDSVTVNTPPPTTPTGVVSQESAFIFYRLFIGTGVLAFLLLITIASLIFTNSVIFKKYKQMKKSNFITRDLDLPMTSVPNTPPISPPITPPPTLSSGPFAESVSNSLPSDELTFTTPIGSTSGVDDASLLLLQRRDNLSRHRICQQSVSSEGVATSTAYVMPTGMPRVQRHQTLRDFGTNPRNQPTLMPHTMFFSQPGDTGNNGLSFGPLVDNQHLLRQDGGVSTAAGFTPLTSANVAADQVSSPVDSTNELTGHPTPNLITQPSSDRGYSAPMQTVVPEGYSAPMQTVVPEDSGAPPPHVLPLERQTLDVAIPPKFVLLYPQFVAYPSTLMNRDMVLSPAPPVNTYRHDQVVPSIAPQSNRTPEMAVPSSEASVPSSEMTV